MEKELIINGKKLKELISSAIKTKYENINFEFDNKDDFAIEIKQDNFKEYISFSDERIIKELNLKELKSELVKIEDLIYLIGFYQNLKLMN